MIDAVMNIAAPEIGADSGMLAVGQQASTDGQFMAVLKDAMAGAQASEDAAAPVPAPEGEAPEVDSLAGELVAAAIAPAIQQVTTQEVATLTGSAVVQPVDMPVTATVGPPVRSDFVEAASVPESEIEVSFDAALETVSAEVDAELAEPVIAAAPAVAGAVEDVQAIAQARSAETPEAAEAPASERTISGQAAVEVESEAVHTASDADGAPIAHDGDQPKEQLLSDDPARTSRPAVAGRPVVQATPVEWRVDASSQSVRLEVAEGQDARAVTQVAGSGTERARSESSSSSGSDSSASATNPNPVGFAQAMRQTTQPAAVQTTEAQSPEQHTRVIDSVVREVRLHQMPTRSDLVVRLDPPELGSLRVRVTQDASGFSTHIQTSSDQVRGLLQAHLPALQDALSGAGVRMESVSVSFDSAFGSAAQDAASGNAFAQQSGARQGFPYNRGYAQGAQAANAIPASYARAEQAGYSWLA